MEDGIIPGSDLRLSVCLSVSEHSFSFLPLLACQTPIKGHRGGQHLTPTNLCISSRPSNPDPHISTQPSRLVALSFVWMPLLRHISPQSLNKNPVLMGSWPEKKTNSVSLGNRWESHSVRVTRMKIVAECFKWTFQIKLQRSQKVQWLILWNCHKHLKIIKRKD